MAFTRLEQRLYDELLDRFGKEIADALMAAIDDLRRSIDLKRMIGALEEGSIEGALDAMNLDRAAYGVLMDAVRAAYVAGGSAAMALAQPPKDAAGHQMVIRFDGRHLRAEAWLSQHSSELVTRIMDDQRAALREALRDGMEKGVNPRTTALEVVGRIDKATGKRTGGLIGLTSQQADFARTARDELRSGDPALLRHYLTRQRRDKRFDRSVAKALREGKPLPAEIAGKAAVAYERRLLQLRGEMIGRTESLTALRTAKHEGYLQAVENGHLNENDIRRTWRSAGDGRVRHTHMSLHGDTVRLREPFKSPSGAMMMFPGDTSLGAGADEVVGCRCDVAYRLDLRPNA